MLEESDFFDITSISEIPIKDPDLILVEGLGKTNEKEEANKDIDAFIHGLIFY